MRLLDRNPRGKPAAVAQGALGAIIALLHPSSTNSQSPQLRTAVCRALGAIAAGDQEMQNHIASQDGVKLLVDVIEECLQSSQVRLAARVSCSCWQGLVLHAQEGWSHALALVSSGHRNVLPVVCWLQGHGIAQLLAPCCASAALSSPLTCPSVPLRGVPQDPLCAALHAMSAVVNHNTFTKNIARQLDILPTLAILLRQPGAASGHAAVFLIRCVADVCDSNHANQEALAEAGLVEGLVGLLSNALADGLQGAQGQVALVQQLARAIGNAGEGLEGGAGALRAVVLCGLWAAAPGCMVAALQRNLKHACCHTA